MYSYAQCTMQERLVCGRDVPCLAHMEQGSGPLHPGHLPTPYLPGVMGTQSTSSLQQGWTWTVEWTLASSPTQNLRLRKMYVWYCSLFLSSITVFWNVPDHVKPGSRCRLSRAHNWFGETPGGREIGMGRVRSIYEQPGAKVDVIAPHKRMDSK